MANNPDIGRLTLRDDDEVQRLFETPVKNEADRISTHASQHKYNSAATEQRHAPQPVPASHSASSIASHDERLRAELEQLRSINGTLEGLNLSLTKSKTNLQTMQGNMNSTKALLKTWSRILSQAEHNQRLLLDPHWQGATKDVEDIQNEELQQQQEAERIAHEETRRKERS
ncbi:hypothetical protein MRB53_040078 [Persea americana]|nr:hypothetical protein MRB53_040078 [Persea americana]